MSYPSSQKLWRVIRQPDAYYYEIKLAGTVIDRIRIEEPTLKIMKNTGIINDN